MQRSHLLEPMGDEQFFAALKRYYKVNIHEIAEMEDLHERVHRRSAAA